MGVPPSVALVNRCRAGDEQAAADLVERFKARLIGLVQGELSRQVAARIDPEDILQSAFGSFFRGLREDRYELERSGELWQLLASITLHKLQHQVQRHHAAKRSVNRERGPKRNGRGLPSEHLSGDPSPLHALALKEELEYLMRDLSPVHREMVEMRLAGYSALEIAKLKGTTERMVWRAWERVRELAQDRQQEIGDG
jgi:RNA polymerase sigma-70 factor (ECF subfamily)